MIFDTSTRLLSGTPSATKVQTTRTYTVTDGDGDTAALSFMLTVKVDTNPCLTGNLLEPDLGSSLVLALVSEIEPLTLPAAYGGQGGDSVLTSTVFTYEYLGEPLSAGFQLRVGVGYLPATFGAEDDYRSELQFFRSF